jgi:ribosomal protein S12 methylthiotransferase
MPKTVNIITLGCAKNLVDSEFLMGELKGRGLHVMHESDEPADCVIVNTCGFINDAKEESVDTILRYAEARKKGLIGRLYVTGCLSQRYAGELEKSIHEVDGFFGTGDIQAILQAMGFDPKTDLIGERCLATPSHYAYLKISEGCDRKCSFCAIPLIRGKQISRSIASLVVESEKLADRGVKELILIAQDLSRYGSDLPVEQNLPNLLRELTRVKGIEWIRLHYAYPAGFPAEVPEIIRDHENICKYIDIPLQHISNRILKSMCRGITTAGTRNLIRKIRTTVPGIAIRTTMMVGYPGETNEEFNELLDFVRESRFERMGVFAYSHEEGTAAYKMKDNIPEGLKRERVELLLEIQQSISLEMNQEKIGKTFKTIIDGKEGEWLTGRTEYDSPEVDNEVLLKDPFLKAGDFCRVKVISASEFDLIGEKV